jgi:hypothetical protein
MGALDLFTELAITEIPIAQQRRPMQTCCRATVESLIRDYGEAHARTVLITIAETGDNARQLVRPVILAVSDVLRIHARWANAGSALLDALDHVDIGKLRAIVKASGVLHAREAIAVLLCAELERHLGPPVLPKPPRIKREPKPPIRLTRVPIIEQRVALGLQLLELKATSRRNNDYSYLRKKHFGDIEPKLAMQVTSVARRYASRPEIFRQASWQALVQLASPSLSAAVPSLRD